MTQGKDFGPSKLKKEKECNAPTLIEISEKSWVLQLRRRATFQLEICEKKKEGAKLLKSLVWWI